MTDLNDNNMMSEKEIKERLFLFKKLKTYTFIKNIYKDFYNGYITKIEDNHIIFKDDYLDEIPIIIKEIIWIDYSIKNKKEVEE